MKNSENLAMSRLIWQHGRTLLFCLPLEASLLLSSWAQSPGSAKPDYSREIQPLIHARCASCHNDSGPQAGLVLLTREAMLKGGKSGPAIVPGSSQQSLLIQRVTGEKQPLMPMGSDPLKSEEIALLKAWIDQGAQWTTGVSAAQWTPLLGPRHPEVPKPTAPRFDSPVDRFISIYLERKGLTFAEPVLDAVFVRRVYLDLWGLLPTSAQRDAFLKDSRVDRRERLIDELLADRKSYSEHWISFWNDLLRNDEGVIYHGERQSITDWLLKALEENVPYNQLVSSLLNPENPDDPKGYLIGVNWRGEVSASQIPAMQAAQNSAQVFMGVNLKCASCHDSFINQWKLRDSYGMAGFFSENELELVRCDVRLGQTSKTKFLYPELGEVETTAPPAVRRAAAARLMTLPQNGRFTRTLVNRYWQKLLGRGLVEPVDDMDQEPWHRDLLDWLASDFADQGYDLKHLLRRILTSQTYQMPAVKTAAKDEKSFVFRGPSLRRLTAEQFVDAVSSVTGEWRVLQAKQGGTGSYSREWHLKSSSLTRTLGRPIRDQVFTSRNEEASTLQAMELVNGEDLAYLLHRGAKRMLNQLEPAATNRFDSGPVTKGKVSFDIDITGARQLWLLAEDVGSYDRSLVVAGWATASLSGPAGEKSLAEFVREPAVRQASLRIEGQELPQALITAVPSQIVVEIAGQGLTRLRGTAGVDESSLRSDISPRVRFFIFTEKPDPRQLVRVGGQPPVMLQSENLTRNALINRVYYHMLGRDPGTQERRVAQEFLAASRKGDKISADGLEDLLWALCLSPEFQFIQ